MRKFKYIAICFLVSFIYSCDSKDPVKPTEPEDEIVFPRKEMRAAWLATVWNLDLPLVTDIATHKKAYTDLLDIYERQRLNAVMVQIRPKADAFYNSPYEPWSQWLTGKQGQDPGYDVLKFMLEETHKRGLEFHAWINPYDIAAVANDFKPHSSHIALQHPEWTMKYGAPGKERLIFRPSHPEVPKFLLKVIDDILAKYDVDGMHFDDYFYPYPVPTGVGGNYPLDDADDYKQYGSEYKSVEDFRRGCVNNLIEDIHDLIVQKYPKVLFSISPYAVWRNKKDDPNGSVTNSLSNYDDLYADVRLWCQKGWIDFVVPQLYQGTTIGTNNNYASFETLVQWWPQNSFDVPVMIGYPLYRFNVDNADDNPGGKFNNTEFDYEFQFARQNSKIQGGVFYNSTAMKLNRKNVLEVMDKYYPKSALIPFMGRKTEEDPQKPTLSLSGGKLLWNAQADGFRYAVYSIKNKTATLEAITTETSFDLSRSGSYCVSAVNKDNNEGKYSDIIMYTK